MGRYAVAARRVAMKSILKMACKVFGHWPKQQHALTGWPDMMLIVPDAPVHCRLCRKELVP